MNERRRPAAPLPIGCWTWTPDEGGRWYASECTGDLILGCGLEPGADGEIHGQVVAVVAPHYGGYRGILMARGQTIASTLRSSLANGMLAMEREAHTQFRLRFPRGNWPTAITSRRDDQAACPDPDSDVLYPPDRNSLMLDEVREIGFDSIMSPDGAREKVFFMGPNTTSGQRIGARATEAAVREFISFWENQVQVAKDYLANGRDNRSTRWTRGH